ncbi:P-II family nitrogen regulator [Parasporobacterium paucivorans]|uniref:Nitrogen regulatory protein P-II family n=1 Tax=Parasporobacterium paucivorans DSM 15970 TaxID=1122934 RepID=A0A1M6DV24_9FIRM|nr:P-II family nitrogen regulator [Parasporobacterium paucivorans]SHI76979.1 nitrogen regulatory protein P-II family [Parasporobacterium paucivorans DSM 15970]
MWKIDAIVREQKYEEIKDVLSEINVHGITVSQVMGCGIQKGYESIVRGTKVDINMLPKIKFEIVVSSKEWADKTMDAISRIAYTGNGGDGKIFLYEIQDAMRISTGQRGPEAIY